MANSRAKNTPPKNDPMTRRSSAKKIPAPSTPSEVEFLLGMGDLHAELSQIFYDKANAKANAIERGETTT